jgi:hypothetical protein
METIESSMELIEHVADGLRLVIDIEGSEVQAGVLVESAYSGVSGYPGVAEVADRSVRGSALPPTIKPRLGG